MNSQLTVAAHILGMLACMESRHEPAVTSEQLAESIGTNPVVVRRILAKLQRAGLIESRRGVGGGSVLARPPGQINLRDAYQAVTEDETPLIGRHAGSCGDQCSIAPVMVEFLDEIYAEAEQSLLNRLAEVSIEGMAREIDKRLAERGLACPSSQKASNPQ